MGPRGLGPVRLNFLECQAGFGVHRMVAEPAQGDVDRALYELGCSINRLRNKEGTGHGRPWVSSVTDDEARIAVEGMGLIADRLMGALKQDN